MTSTVNAFLDLAFASGVLRLGSFTLKSGRVSPYFFNLGAISSGAAMRTLAGLYADRLLESPVSFDMLFGPAYKGIPLVTAVSVALAERGRDCPFAYNRKEAKAHGEGGVIIGAPLTGRVLVVDDVMTAGTAVRESLELIREAGATPAGLAIALDRQERDANGSQSAVQALTASGVPVCSIATFADVIAYLEARETPAETLAAMHAYRDQYGA